MLLILNKQVYTPGTLSKGESTVVPLAKRVSVDLQTKLSSCTLVTLFNADLRRL